MCNDSSHVQPEPLLNDKEAAEFLGGLHPKTYPTYGKTWRDSALPCRQVLSLSPSELNQWLCATFAAPDNPSASTRKETHEA